MIAVAEGPQLTTALEHWQAKRPLPTALSSAEIVTQLGRDIHREAVVIARCTSGEMTQRFAEHIASALSGEIEMAEFVKRCRRDLIALGYDPSRGFPGDEGAVPPAEAGSIRDLFSERRLKLIFSTAVATARNYGRVLAGNTPGARFNFPAWQLVRLEWRRVERGSPNSPSPGWQRRWHDAGESVDWVGALRPDGSGTTPMIALKDSPLWPAMGRGVGGYTDSLGNPYPPFWLNSGGDWRAVPRAECLGHRLIIDSDAEVAPMKAELFSPSKAQQMFDRLSPELRAVVMKGLAA